MSTSLDLQAERPFGSFAPRGWRALILKLCHALPASMPLARNLNKLLRGLIKRPLRQFDVTSGGLKLRLRSGGNYCEKRQLFEPQFYDTEEIRWLCAVLADGGTFLDIGGNIGLYSLHVGARCPQARIITVEMDAELAERMQFNARLNDIEIELAAQALSDYDGTGQLSHGRNRGENTLQSDGDGLAVPVSTLLHLCEQRQVKAITAMKIDIEGHEDRVLGHFFAHAPQSLWPGKIVIEHVHDEQHIVARLQSEQGYRIEARTSRNVLLSR